MDTFRSLLFVVGRLLFKSRLLFCFKEKFSDCDWEGFVKNMYYLYFRVFSTSVLLNFRFLVQQRRCFWLFGWWWRGSHLRKCLTSLFPLSTYVVLCVRRILSHPSPLKRTLLFPPKKKRTFLFLRSSVLLRRYLNKKKDVTDCISELVSKLIYLCIYI